MTMEFVLGATGIATLQSDGLVDAYSSLFEVVDNAGRASLFFFAAGCFHKVITTQGSDIDNLLEGAHANPVPGTLDQGVYIQLDSTPLALTIAVP